MAGTREEVDNKGDKLSVVRPTDGPTVGVLPPIDNVEEEDVFFEALAQPKAYTTTHKQQATQLRDAVRTKWPGKARSPKLDDWALTFAKLERQQDASRIQATLDWYCKNLGGEFVPVAMSATSFHKKWHNIEQAHHRADPATIPVTPGARKLATKLEALTWPKGAAARLAPAVDKWLDWATKLREDTKDWLTETLPADWAKYGQVTEAGCKANSLPFNEPGWTDAIPKWHHGYTDLRHIEYAAQWLVKALDNPESFVALWFRNFHKGKHGWDAWSGTFPDPGLDALHELVSQPKGLPLLVETLCGNNALPEPPTAAEIKQWHAVQRPYTPR